MEITPGGVADRAESPSWHTGAGVLDLGQRGVIMGILNLTPDSFSDGGRFQNVDTAVAHGLEMVAEGAAILDLGGESTRPGSLPVSTEEECRRVIPVLESLRARTKALLSVDTSKSEVARRAIDAGADIVNDVTALRGDPGMAGVLAGSNCGVVLMHMRGTPATMQDEPRYGDVLAEVSQFLRERVDFCVRHGISKERLCIDPGIGFGKTHGHNRDLLCGLPALCSQGLPVLLGISRKAFLGQVTGAAMPADRLWAGVTVTAVARRAGVRIFRVHDVRENLHALRVTEAILSHA